MRTVVEGWQNRIQTYFNCEGIKIRNKDFLFLVKEKIEEGEKKNERKTTRTKKTN